MSTNSEEKPLLPKPSFTELVRWRRKLRAILDPYEGTEITYQELDPMAAAIACVLHKRTPVSAGPLQEVEQAHQQSARSAVVRAVRSSLAEGLAGTTLNARTISYLSIRLAGNALRLATGTAVLPWKTGAVQEWAMIEVTDARGRKSPKLEVQGTKLSYIVLTGCLAGNTFSQFFPDSIVNQIGKRIGLLPKRSYHSLHYRELVRMRLYFNLTKSMEVTASQFMSRQSLDNRNKHRYEQRHGKVGCVQPNRYPCQFCPIGYKTCANGTHSETYEQRLCKNGHNGMFDKRGRESLCLNCEVSKWWATHQ